MTFHKIILSRTDGIGDVILSLPMAGIIKSAYPNCKVIFLGKEYTRNIIELSENIDQFIALEEIQILENKEQIEFLKNINAEAIIHVFPRKKIAQLALKANIPFRIGTSHRFFHWLTCNKKLHFSRYKSQLHEAQLNIKLLSGINIDHFYELNELHKYYGLSKIPSLSEDLKVLVKPDKFNLIVHPKSKGSAREWGLPNYKRLIELLPKDKFQIFITGTENEGKEILRELNFEQENLVNLCGKLNLSQLTAFIAKADGLLACSTGPLHIAAALDKFALGIYAPMRPIHPGRWSPLGKNASFLVKEGECNKCKKSKNCDCIIGISPDTVVERLTMFYKNLKS